jgi:hypothetical protein
MIIQNDSILNEFAPTDANLLLKGAWARESINRIPMIWADPAQPTVSRSQTLASTVDNGSIISARARLAPHFGVQGNG